MKAKALICDEEQNFSIEDVEIQEPAADQICIKTMYSGVSVGTEFALIRNKISWGPFPLCTGYMSTGIVEQVGSEVANFKVGDRVYSRGGDGLTLSDGTVVTAVTGGHCSRMVIDPNSTHGVAAIIGDCDMEVASMFVMPAVGLYGVDMANPRMGDLVVVYGCGQVGMGVLAACVHRGCRVVGIDMSDDQLELATEFGADYIFNSADVDVLAEIEKISPGGADVVFECTGIPSCIDVSISMCKTLGTFVWQGNYGAKPVEFNFLSAHGKKLQMHFPCDDGLQPCRRAVVKNMAMGALKWEKFISHRISYTDAPDMYSRINAGEKGITGIMINWQAKGD